MKFTKYTKKNLSQREVTIIFVPFAVIKKNTETMVVEDVTGVSKSTEKVFLRRLPLSRG